MKMLGEEKELRCWLSFACGNDRERRAISRKITAFRRAVVEDCAKVAEEYTEENMTSDMVYMRPNIAQAIRGRR